MCYCTGLSLRNISYISPEREKSVPKKRKNADETLRQVIGLLAHLTGDELDVVLREAASLRPAAPVARTIKPTGILVQQWVKCGKDSCRCASGGQQHGPYWYRRWRDSEGRYRGTYLGKRLPPEIAEASGKLKG